MPTKSRNRRSPKRLARRMKPTRHLSRRKGSGKKGSARARNPKKMRGGVTRRRLSQLTQQELFAALEELPVDVVKQIAKMHPLLIPPFTNDTLRRAVEDYVAGGARKEDIKKKYGEINNWDVSNVTDMALLFKDESSFNQPLNKWDVSNVTYMNRMFDGAESFNQPLNKWNVSNVTYMNSMFWNAESFNQPLNNWNVSNVKNMAWMFEDASSFNQPLHAPWYHDEESDSE